MAIKRWTAWMLPTFGWQAIPVYIIIARVLLTLCAVVLLPDRSKVGLPVPTALTPAEGRPAGRKRSETVLTPSLLSARMQGAGSYRRARCYPLVTPEKGVEHCG
jgi:hypothetical protein